MSCGLVGDTSVPAARSRSPAACWPQSRCPAQQRSAWSTPGWKALVVPPRWSEKIRVNVVSPPWVTETLIAYKMDPAHGIPAAEVAKAYVKSVEGDATGQT